MLRLYFGRGTWTTEYDTVVLRLVIFIPLLHLGSGCLGHFGWWNT